MSLVADGSTLIVSWVAQALALGASTVLLGRPVLYGLAVGGQAGVERVLELLRRELELSMALAGCASLRDVGPQVLMAPSWAGTGSGAAPQGCCRAQGCAKGGEESCWCKARTDGPRSRL